MRISIIQPDLFWEDKEHNFANLEKMIIPLYNRTDIIILPEMFNSGFSMNTGHLGESPDSETFGWMKDTAFKGNFGVCGSYIVKDNNQFFNRWVFVSPQNETWYYDKRHLFRLGEEDKLFSAGKSTLVFSFRGARISPYICYDLRFPVWSRNREKYDLMIYAANWPESRKEVWNTLLKARAIENQCYVAGANRLGIDGKGITYCGESVILDPRGQVIASANINEETTITGEISMTELSDFRMKFPILNDADDFTINI